MTTVPIRVAHIVTPEGIYGAERWVATVLRHLDPGRVRAEIVLVGTKPGARHAAAFFRDHGFSLTHIARGGKLNPLAVADLAAWTKRRRIEILHSHGFKSDVLSVLARRRYRRLRIVTTPHGWSADEGPRIAFYERVGRLFMKKFDRIFPLSRGLLDDLIARGFPRQRIELIANGVDDTPLRALFDERQRRPANAAPVFAFIGRLCAQKGVFELLEAFAGAALPRESALLLVGAGPARAALAARAAQLGLDGRLHMTGFVDDVVPILRRADAVVLPSHSEGLPRVLMEACAAGVPVIGTNIPGIRELITHGYNGLLVPLRDAGRLGEALQRIVCDAPGVARMVRHARAVIERSHTASAQARSFERAYDNLARAHAGDGTS